MSILVCYNHTIMKPKAPIPENWFTSDTHFGHANVIKYSNRPYADTNEMDEALISNWNAKVKPHDNVFHTGDVFFCSKQRGIEILERLNGKITLIMGNHDRRIRRDESFKSKFANVVDYHELNINKQIIVMSHYPMLTWRNSGYGSWMLHGHSHGSMRYPFNGKIHDIGVDPNNYAPICFDELKAIMDAKPISVLDHHTED